MIARDVKRAKLIAKHKTKRENLKNLISIIHWLYFIQVEQQEDLSVFVIDQAVYFFSI